MAPPFRLLLTLLMAPLAACAVGPTSDTTAQNANTPGWTGSTTVIGSSSTIGGDAAATYNQQKWPLGRR